MSPPAEPEFTVSPVTVWYLEMTDPTALVPGPEPQRAVQLQEEVPDANRSRFFYSLVGTPWRWVDRLEWPAQRWQAWVDRPGYRQVTAWDGERPAGYYELDRVADAVELAYFGLAPGFIGRGLGGWLLADAVRQAWTQGDTGRVWLHTCSLDAPAALANYRARGFRIYDHEIEQRDAGGRLV